MIRKLIIVGAAALVCGCTAMSDPLHIAKKDPLQAITPTEQYSIKVTKGMDEILLAPHPDGVSDAQAQALSQLVERWRSAGGDGGIVVRSPAAGHESMYHATAAVQNALENLGVHAEQIELTTYDAPEGAPIGVGFVGYHAEGPDCGRDWHDFTQTGDNKVNPNFGCAVTANIASMIANPGDLLAPRPMDSGDVQRRETILGKYRQGVVSSTPKDPQADGGISGAIQ
ncbi:MAG TPA: CpaD family pilus assembly lipoprotein [Caulobacteraceae bacterium]|nr:CpaD family pilus assembly lipoprotein [Caulobacteraceae bacterium]